MEKVLKRPAVIASKVDQEFSAYKTICAGCKALALRLSAAEGSMLTSFA